MNSNNLFIIAPHLAQEHISIADFDFKGCTGIAINRYDFVSEKKNMRTWAKLLTNSKVILTIGDWALDKQLNDLVKIARILEIEVIHEANFKKYVEQQNN